MQVGLDRVVLYFTKEVYEMGFWIFIFIMLLIIPLTMILFGRYFIKSVPKKINDVFGYRTTMSMKNMDTWTFAHTHCGKLWYNLGRILLPITTLPMLFVIGKGVDEVGYFSLIFNVIQISCLVGSIFPTERALKKTFDENGIRRK